MSSTEVTCLLPLGRVVPRNAIAVLSLAGLLSSASPADASSIVNVSGVSLACFGEECTEFSSTATSADSFGVTFAGASFDVAAYDSGEATGLVLGSISRSLVNVSDGEPELPFTVLIIFTLPTVIVGSGDETFTAYIHATNYGGGGPLDVDFDNAWRLLTYSNEYGSGSFEFSITSDPFLPKFSTRSIVGSIRNVMFTPVANDTTVPGGPTVPTQEVPEPTVMLLLGAGVVVAARRKRAG